MGRAGKVLLFFIFIGVLCSSGFAVGNGPEGPEECVAVLLRQKLERKDGGMLEIRELPVIVEGSLGKTRGVSSRGGLQPDYWISAQDPVLKEFLQEAARRVSTLQAQQSGVDRRQIIQTIQKLLQEKMPHRSPEDPRYLEMLARYRKRKKLVPLGEYLVAGAGVCREFALLTHLALRHVGIEARFVYVQHVYRGRVEDHAVNLAEVDGKTTVVDSYYTLYNLQPMDDLLASSQILRINPYPKSWQGLAPQRSGANFAERFRAYPLEVEKEVRGHWWDLKESARFTEDTTYNETEFPFPEVAPTVAQAIQELEKALALPATSELGLSEKYRALIAQGLAVSQAGYLYKDVIAFVVAWVEAMEPLAAHQWKEGDPQAWVSQYFMRTFKQYFQDIALNPVQGLVFPWFTPPEETVVDMDFFIRSRATRLYLLGLRPQVTRTDGDPLGPLDFFYHDLEHAYRQKTQTYLIINGFERPERAALQALWDRRVQNLLAERDRLLHEDVEVGTAFTYLLFELMHERGFAPDFQSLRDQTASPRWTTVIERKLRNRFWFPETRTSPSFAQLEIARLRLHQFVSGQGRAETDWLRTRLLSTTDPFQTKATVRIQTPARAHSGKVVAVEFGEDNTIQVALESIRGGKAKRFAEKDINLEQVFFEMPRKITAEVAARYAQALALRKDGQLVAVRVHAMSGEPEVYGLDGKWSVFGVAASNAAAMLPGQPLTPHQIYRLEQLYSLLSRGLSTDALVLSPAEVLRGVIQSARGSVADYSLEMTTVEGKKVRFKPTDALIVALDE